MRNIPLFTTDNGVASLVLNQIPLKGEAYIQIQSASDSVALLNECTQFCKMAGANCVYASGYEISDYPIYTHLIELAIPRTLISSVNANTVLAGESSWNEWKNIYNARMSKVPCSALLSSYDKHRFLGKSYFVYEKDQMIGIGACEKDQVLALVSLIPGMGETVLCALCRHVAGREIRLEVAKENIPAMLLYTRMGFSERKELCRWYKIFDMSSKNT